MKNQNEHRAAAMLLGITIGLVVGLSARADEASCAWTHTEDEQAVAATEAFPQFFERRTGCGEAKHVQRGCVGLVRCDGKVDIALCEATGDHQCPTAEQCYTQQSFPGNPNHLKSDAHDGKPPTGYAYASRLQRDDGKSVEGLGYKTKDGAFKVAVTVGGRADGAIPAPENLDKKPGCFEISDRRPSEVPYSSNEKPKKPHKGTAKGAK